VILALGLLWPASAAAKVLSVGVDEANFRSGPSTKHEVVFTAIRHFPVKVLERVKGWVKVEDFEGDSGWVASYLLTEVPTVIISVDKANLRKAPSTSSGVADVAERSQVFRVVEKKGDWLKLAVGKEERGWIRNDLVWGDGS
jgi:SH3-like domain-containing protein